ncbi:uncharacterized protein [Ptychodera flava]|uniref:uncharacterized protein n=1 Tax=Ptychodera flava TaxID=63121 RepID=UPI00396A0305
MTQYWDLETLGIKENYNTDITNNVWFEKYRVTHLERSLEGQYIASLPWHEENPPLPTSFEIANLRTRPMVRRLEPELRYKYDDIIMDQVAKGFISKMDNADHSKGHYLPHHAVKKDSETTPIRIVYDCSCQKSSEQPSLNDCLEKGPHLLNDLSAILLRFRAHNVGFSSDIEKAFLHVQMADKDRDYTKFLWISDPDNPEIHVSAKKLIQELWQQQRGWDEQIPEHLEQEWHKIRSNLKDALDIQINRQYIKELTQEKECELHVFSDASQSAYGAPVYIKHGKLTSLFMAKSRVKPLKDISLPCLELMGAVIATRLANHVTYALHGTLSLSMDQQPSSYPLDFYFKTERKQDSHGNPNISVQDTRDAEALLITGIQAEMHVNEIAALRKTRTMREPLVRQLQLFIDRDGILRPGGRLHNAPINEETKFPILLPRNHAFTRLVIQQLTSEYFTQECRQP